MMKVLSRHQFLNDRAFETVYLSAEDLERLQKPECDVIGLRRVDSDAAPMTIMRPDEALIMARMLIDAVRAVTEDYTIANPVLDSRS